jgi:hypothetical protein
VLEDRGAVRRALAWEGVRDPEAVVAATPAAGWQGLARVSVRA